jgi:hypothetical protein
MVRNDGPVLIGGSPNDERPGRQTSESSVHEKSNVGEVAVEERLIKESKARDRAIFYLIEIDNPAF